MSTPNDTTPKRKCTKCGNEYPPNLECFSPDKKGKNGLHSWCRTCLRAAAKAHYAKTQQTQVENKRKYRAENLEKVQQRNRKTYKKNRERYLEDKKRYVAENPEKLREHWRRMHALRNNAPGHHTREQERELYEEQEHRCAYCGITMFEGEYQPDHMIPIARNGSDDIENIVIVCTPCNQSKHTAAFDEWKDRRGW